MVGWLVGWLVGGLVDEWGVGLVDGLVGWFAAWQSQHTTSQPTNSAYALI